MSRFLAFGDRRHPFMPYLRAHGNAAGPTQRPVLAGALAGLVAGLAATPLLLAAGALASSARAVGLLPGAVLALHALISLVAGVLYGRVFQRSADDRCGGWIFGLSYGFLLWMLGPVTIVHRLFGRPLAVGPAAMTLLGLNLVYGLALGLTYPWIHHWLQPSLEEQDEEAAAGSFGSAAAP